MNMRDIVDILFLLLVFAGVLFATYFVTKKMAVLNRRMQFNKNMQIIEVLQLGQGQYLYIVKVGEDYHLIGCAKDGVSYCTKLDGTQLNLQIPQEKSFQEHLVGFVKDWQVKKHEE